MLRSCGCGARFAPDLERCPQCRKAVKVSAKITGDGPTYAEGHAPGDGEEHVRPGYGEPMTGVEVPADGTEATISNEDGEPGEQVTQLPPGEFAAPEPPAAAPRTPPRRPPGASGG